MHLERAKLNQKLEMEVTVKGNSNGKEIAPFLMLPFIENSFMYCGQMKEQSWINMDITIEGDWFSMKLANGMSEQINEQTMFSAKRLANVRKRLNLLYPGSHDLRLTAEQEMFIVFLNIRLDDIYPNSFESEKENKSREIPSNKSLKAILNYASD